MSRYVIEVQHSLKVYEGKDSEHGFNHKITHR